MENLQEHLGVAFQTSVPDLLHLCQKHVDMKAEIELLRGKLAEEGNKVRINEDLMRNDKIIRREMEARLTGQIAKQEGDLRALTENLRLNVSENEKRQREDRAHFDKEIEKFKSQIANLEEDIRVKAENLRLNEEEKIAKRSESAELTRKQRARFVKEIDELKCQLAKQDEDLRVRMEKFQLEEGKIAKVSENAKLQRELYVNEIEKLKRRLAKQEEDLSASTKRCKELETVRISESVEHLKEENDKLTRQLVEERARLGGKIVKLDRKIVEDETLHRELEEKSALSDTNLQKLKRQFEEEKTNLLEEIEQLKRERVEEPFWIEWGTGDSRYKRRF